MKTSFAIAFLFVSALPVRAAEVPDALSSGEFHWRCSPPLVSPANRPEDPCYSVKDPTIVFADGRWHLFSTIRSQKRTHQIEYLSFADWKDAEAAPRHVLTITNGYFCAPQVFWFTPHKKWYLVYQALDTRRKPALQPAFSTTETLTNPASWTSPAFFYATNPPGITGWIDFWVICDEAKAHLFFTSNNGLMWRAETALADFPRGWSVPQVVLRDDIFEASHTYRLRGQDRYLTVVEAEGGGRRYYKAYLADRLDGVWKPLAATRQKSFAGAANVSTDGAKWTESISHGELLRAGNDEKLEIDPARLRFLFQGVTDAQMRGKKYGEIPWRLGLLEPAP